ncbi:hypothetical protein SRB5_52630 [Streptomyces sp. RB5]|uniref:Secreted protein n=1 Tax=Streptomyces smaragdinus TaxID=2585196 RepID=A0A7K0CNM6_9ACTN|nr:hypothetical protein [Streptomyces smaragdinus]MQY15085.1 hypothetical protein [Streptomyces smaragdinus]
MSYPSPAGSAAPPVQPAAAAVPAQPGPGGPPVPPPSAAPPERRSAFAEGMDRFRRAAVTEPGRLRIIGAVLAVLVVVFGAVTAWQVTDRSSAADDVLLRSQPLSRDAAEIYRSLADANTTAASGFLAGGEEPREVRKRYEDDIDQAGTLLVRAAANSQGAAAARTKITEINRWLPQYTAAIETARANNRQGLPLGGAYLRYANGLMDEKLLPAASELYEAETAQLNDDYAAAKSWPWLALALGVVALGVLLWAQRRHYRRTNRVFNQGMVVASALTAVVLLWLAVGHTLARAGLNDSDKNGAQSLMVLNQARIESLKAHGNEGLKMVSRGAVTKGNDQDAYEVDYGASMTDLAGKDAETLDDSLMEKALALAGDDDAGRVPVEKAVDGVREWQTRHKAMLEADNAGNYDKAVHQVIGGANEKATGECFDVVNKALAQAIDHEQQQFDAAAADGRDALGGLWIGAAVLAVLGAAGALLGIGRRLSEYR